MHSDAVDVVASTLDLTGMHSAAKLQAENAHRVSNGLGEPDYSCPAVKCCEDTVAGRVHPLSAVAFEFASDECIVLIE